MDEKELRDLENLRHQIVGLKEQMSRLAKSQRSILSAQRTQLEQYRSDAVKPYAEKLSRALGSADEQAHSTNDWLRELEAVQHELEAAVSSGEEPPGPEAEETTGAGEETQPETDQAEET